MKNVYAFPLISLKQMCYVKKSEKSILNPVMSKIVKPESLTSKKSIIQSKRYNGSVQTEFRLEYQI